MEEIGEVVVGTFILCIVIGLPFAGYNTGYNKGYKKAQYEMCINDIVNTTTVKEAKEIKEKCKSD